ncbi:outer membrane lipoprotein chaperone LolA [Massilia psychrophila]|jgi:outer membrane lipoprotein carrier protein|uniref:Outer-membrane lipoprotein carrier protein n=1 Tax=Massilia psychrophila TaxID=1603353 RepID=A0A2G8T4J3_9BURK|nr:outer membrane lipoprotein chaperone LolA [Massilia psychrophila]PIL40975.1 outer membrane lipoprotein chaperone LolA [Massilia psychrophila]GGE68839.1 outer-membrane lipoprotein carrier protein [Massilia psychrophila]
MNFNKKFTLVALLAAGALTLTGAAHAGALEQFKTFVASTHAARGEFSQQQMKKSDTKAATGKAAQVSTGTFVFARPGKFIWTYLKPYEQLLQADGEQLYIFDKDLNQVTVKKLGSVLGSSPAAILFGSNDLDKNFTLSEAGSRGGLEWLNAKPKAKDSTFEQISIGLRNGTPEAMELHDAFGSTSVISFKKFEKNPPLSAQQFKFVMPKGADVFNN